MDHLSHPRCEPGFGTVTPSSATAFFTFIIGIPNSPFKAMPAYLLKSHILTKFALARLRPGELGENPVFAH
jgi:hypothetical protein